MCSGMFKEYVFYQWGIHWDKDGKLTRDEAHKHLTRYALCTIKKDGTYSLMAYDITFKEGWVEIPINSIIVWSENPPIFPKEMIECATCNCWANELYNQIITLHDPEHSKYVNQFDEDGSLTKKRFML